MFELSPNLTLLFTEAGPTAADRIRAAAAAGFRLVDTWALPSPEEEHDVREALDETGIRISVATAPLAGPANDPAALAANLVALRDALPVAQRMGVRSLVVTADRTVPDLTAERQRAALAEFLALGADVVAGSGVGLLLENLNSRVDHVGCFLDSGPETIAIVRELGRPEVRVLYDAYHSIVMGERVGEVLDGSVDLVEHVQVADAPGRHEAGTGGVDWAGLLDDLRAVGYSGALGLEYLPTIESVASTEALRRAIAG